MSSPTEQSNHPDARMHQLPVHIYMERAQAVLTICVLDLYLEHAKIGPAEREEVEQSRQAFHEGLEKQKAAAYLQH